MPGPIYREPFNDAVHMRRRFAPLGVVAGTTYDVSWSLSVATALAAAAMAADLSSGIFSASGGLQSQVQRSGYAGGSLFGATGFEGLASGSRFCLEVLPATAGQAVSGGAIVAAAAQLITVGRADYASGAADYAAAGLGVRAGLDGSSMGLSIGYVELSSAAIGADGQGRLGAECGLVAAAGFSGVGGIISAAMSPLPALAAQQNMGAGALKAASVFAAPATHQGVVAPLLRAIGAFTAAAAERAIVVLDRSRRRFTVVFMRTWR